MRKIDGRKFSIMILFLTLLSAGCVTVKGDISLNGDGSVTVMLDYKIAPFAAEIRDLATGKRIVPLPLDETELSEILAGLNNPDVSLFRRQEDGTPGAVLTVKFSTIQDFTGFCSRAAYIDAEYTEDENGRHLVLPQPRIPVNTDETGMRLLTVMESGEGIELRLHGPADFTDASGGETPDNETVAIKVPASDLYAGTDAAPVSVRW